MSDPIQPTPEELAASRKAREDAINARVSELVANEGKWFVRNDGMGQPTLVKKYIGIHILGGVATYVYSVEIPGHAAWNPSATDFLKSYTLLDPQPEAKQPATDLPH